MSLRTLNTCVRRSRAATAPKLRLVGQTVLNSVGSGIKPGKLLGVTKRSPGLAALLRPRSVGSATRSTFVMSIMFARLCTRGPAVGSGITATVIPFSPATVDVTVQEYWALLAVGAVIAVSDTSQKRPHVAGAIKVGLTRTTANTVAASNFKPLVTCSSGGASRMSPRNAKHRYTMWAARLANSTPVSLPPSAAENANGSARARPDNCT